MQANSGKNAKPSPTDTSPNPNPPKPKLILPLGRGGHGKSLWARWMIDRAQSRGREIVVADADRTNPSLAAYFAGVLTPPSAGESDMEDWFAALCEQQALGGFNALIDLGGGDQLLKSIAGQMKLGPFIEALGIEPVAVHLIGPDLEDLTYLRDLEKDELFAPAATILVLNEGLVPGKRSPARAFQEILEHPVFKTAAKRGAQPIWMPPLAPAREIALRHITINAADAGRSSERRPPVGPWNRQLITMWRKTMEQNFAPVQAWLA